MKKLLVLFIASSLSLFATIDGHDENLIIKAIEQSKKRFNDEISLTDIYVEENKTTPKGGKEIVFENTLNAIEAYDYNKEKLFYEKYYLGKEGMCEAYDILYGDKLNNVVVIKFKHLGKTRFEFKLDASMCR